MSQRVTTLCVCVSKFIFKCVWAHYYSPCAAPAICLITFQSPLYCMSGWHTTRTQTHTHLLKVRIASSFFWLHHPRPLLPFSFTSHVSSLFSLSFSTLFVSVQAYSLAFLPSPLYLPPSPFLTGKKKNILSPSGKKSGCIRVMRKFKSLKEDCTVACTKLIFSQCERVCSCARVCVWFLFQYACIYIFSFEECLSIFAFMSMCFPLVSQLFHFLFFLPFSVSVSAKSEISAVNVFYLVHK